MEKKILWIENLNEEIDNDREDNINSLIIRFRFNSLAITIFTLYILLEYIIIFL